MLPRRGKGIYEKSEGAVGPVHVFNGHSVKTAIAANKHSYSLVGVLKMNSVDHDVGNVGHTVGLVGGQGRENRRPRRRRDCVYAEIPSRTEEMESVLIFIVLFVWKADVNILDAHPLPVCEKPGEGALVDDVEISHGKVSHALENKRPP